MNIAKFCIRHKVTTLLAVIMIAVFGVVYTTQLQMALLPNIEYPAAYVYCYYNGAGPEDIEQLERTMKQGAVNGCTGLEMIDEAKLHELVPAVVQVCHVVQEQRHHGPVPVYGGSGRERTRQRRGLLL